MMRDHREQAIRERAYSIWEQDGRTDGKDLDHWLRAEADLGQRISSLGVEVAYEDATGLRLPDENPAFLWAKVLIPYFFGQFDSKAIRADISEQAKTLRIVFTSSPVPNALMKGSIQGNAQIRLNLGLYIALLSMPDTIRFIRNILLKQRITPEELGSIQAPASSVNELMQLMVMWIKSKENDWKAMTFPVTPLPFVIPNPNFAFPLLFFVMAHEFAHYYGDYVMDRRWVQERDSHAEAVIRKFLAEEQYLRDISIDDEAQDVRELLKDPKVISSWRDEIAADLWAFSACLERFAPSYSGARLPTGGVVCEPTFQSSREVRMYANIAAEILFGMAKFVEVFMVKILGESQNVSTHPTAVWRQELFVYALSNCSPNLWRFMGEDYGSGLIARNTMDSVLKQFLTKFELARQRG